MRINHNIAALNTHRALTSNTMAGSKALEKLSSGYRINRAGDDAAGLAISEKMRAQIRGLDMASKNAQDGISLIQTAEGALAETHSILQRMRELADQSANGTNTDADREALQAEIEELKDEIDRIGNTTEFNTMKLLNGALKSDGVTIGQNTTTSSVVANLTAAKMTSAEILSGVNFNTSGDNFANADEFTIDGHTFDVDWNTLLTTDEKTLLKQDFSGQTVSDETFASIATALERAINQAIDNYNATNAAGATVGHINLYFDSSNNINIESSVEGVESQIKIGAGHSGSVGSLFLQSTTGTTIASGGVEDTGEAEFINDLGLSDNMLFKINGISFTTADLSGAISGGDSGTTLASGAEMLENAINAAISGYNSGNGFSSADEGYIRNVTVTTTNDGRLVINSESGPLEFVERDGEDFVESIGLTQAQTDSAGAGGMTFQIGANRGQTITFGIGDMRSAALGITGVDISTKAGAQAALDSLDNAITNVSSQRAKLGAVQNRLEHTINNLGAASENLTAAESRIRDVDMAKEMMEFTKNNILSQAAQAMLAQANQQPQGVLQLLG